jgi:hypothetical protein
MTRKATVYHDNIADTLSKSLEEICSKASRCANIIQVLRTKSIKQQLAEVYTKLFYFLRDTMEWYLKSKVARFFGSFNENVKKRFEETARSIDLKIEQMYKEAGIGGLAIQQDILSEVLLTGQVVEQIYQRQTETRIFDQPTLQALISESEEAVIAQQDAQITFSKRSCPN